MFFNPDFLRGQTPTLTFQIDYDEIDLTAVDRIEVTMRQRYGKKYTKAAQDITGITQNTFDVHLSEDETMAMCPGELRVQAYFRLTDGNKIGTDIVLLNVGDKEKGEKMDG